MSMYPLAQEVISKHYCPPTVVDSICSETQNAIHKSTTVSFTLNKKKNPTADGLFVVESLDSRCPSSGEGDEVRSDVSHQSRGALLGTALPLRSLCGPLGLGQKLSALSSVNDKRPPKNS
ncbi:hypothetical protein CDAR_486221 [Caerostris darwini]|uniref:Uncharacterized protein n=1 Tax=Caerostris darwini TaxID=1538125 RepID=A0AAV4M9P0_9ARAC|nr:hypothetical protein CDAR_486221 [Caerostris darwini]